MEKKKALDVIENFKEHSIPAYIDSQSPATKDDLIKLQIKSANLIEEVVKSL